MPARRILPPALALALPLALALALALTACGDSGDGAGPVIVTDTSLANSLAVKQNEAFEDAGLFGTRVGDAGGRCRGGLVRWSCTVDVQVNERIGDRRVFAVTVEPKGCWVARQTGTDVGRTGTPSRPGNPLTLRGCIE